MGFESRYREQVRLLVRILPIVDETPLLALKGGTAINLFVREMPRLSVDIDLAYLPTEPRPEALSRCRDALGRMAAAIERRIPGTRVQQRANRSDELRVLVRQGRSQVVIEVSPVLCGTIHPPVRRDVVEAVEEEYGFASINVVSLPDLYGSKICAALDRQHPRDFFDVKQLLDAGELDRPVFLGFLVYLLGHPRPMNEVLQPRWKPIRGVVEREFTGMTREPVALAELEAVRERLTERLKEHLTDRDAEFLLSFKRGEPDWQLLALGGVADLPAVRWKLQNIARLDAGKHAAYLKKLESALDRMRGTA